MYTGDMEFLVYTDGGSRGNPGPSSCAAVLHRRMESHHLWEEVSKEGRYLGDRLTNNHAEYHGLLLGLELAIKAGARGCPLVVRMDSELVVKQMKGIYKYKNLDLLKIAELVIIAAASSHIRLDFEHVPRERNQEADRLCNLAMDKEKKRRVLVGAVAQ